MHFFRILLTVMLPLFLVAPLSTAAETITPKTLPTLKAAIPLLKPFGFINENGIQGVFYDYFQEAAALLGVRVDIKLVPHSRMFYLLSAGKIDAAIYYKDAELEGQLDDYGSMPTLKLHTHRNFIFYKKGLNILRPTDIAKMRLAVLNKGHFYDLFKDDPRYKFIDVKDYSQSIDLFNKGRIEGLAVLGSSFYLMMHEVGLSPSEFGPPYELAPKDLWVHFAQNSTFLKQRIRLLNALEALAKKQTYKKLMAKYIPQGLVPAGMKED